MKLKKNTRYFTLLETAKKKNNRFTFEMFDEWEKQEIITELLKCLIANRDKRCFEWFMKHPGQDMLINSINNLMQILVYRSQYKIILERKDTLIASLENMLISYPPFIKLINKHLKLI